MSDTSDKPSLESAAATTDSGEQQPPAAAGVANNDAPVTAFRPRRRAAVRFEVLPDLAVDSGTADTEQQRAVLTQEQADKADSEALDALRPSSAPDAQIASNTSNIPSDSAPPAPASAPAAAEDPKAPKAEEVGDAESTAAIVPDLSRPADLPKKPEPPARATGFVPSSVATAPVLSVQLGDEGASPAPSPASTSASASPNAATAPSNQSPAPASQPMADEKPETKVEVPPAEKVPDFQEWLRQRQEALRKAREAAKKERADTLNLKPVTGVPSPDEDEQRHEPSLAVPTSTDAPKDSSADGKSASQTGSPAAASAASSPSPSPSSSPGAPAAAVPEGGVGFNPNRTGRRSPVFNIPPPTGAIAGEPSDPATQQSSPPPTSSVQGSSAAPRPPTPTGNEAQPFVLNEESLGSAEAVEKVLASTELAETPALKALKKFLEQGKPAPVVVEKPNPFKKIKQAISLKAMGRLIAKPISQLVSSAILLGGWTLVVVGFVVFFLSLNPVPFVDTTGRVFWLFQANYASHWAALPRYYNAGVVIPWFLVFVLSAAAFVWITTGLALVFRLRKPVSAYLERTLDRRWYQLKNLFLKPVTPEDALLKTSINDIESMLAQARKEAEDAVKKRKVAAAGGTPGGSQANSISQGGAESSALAQAAASRGSGGNG